MTELSMQELAETVVDSAVPMYPAISPDGRAVAYVVKSLDAGERVVNALWVADVDGRAARRLTDGSSWVGAPRWAPDSASLYVLTAGQVHRLGLDDAPAEAVTVRQGGIAGFAPLVDGRTLALTAFDEAGDGTDVGDVFVWDGRSRPARLWFLDLDSGETRLVAGLGDRHVAEVVQRPDGGPLAVLTWADSDEDTGALAPELHLVDVATGKVRDLGPVGADTCAPRWWRSGDAWHVSYLAVTPPDLVGGTAVFDLTVPEAGPVGEHRNLTAGMGMCPTELVQVADGPPLVLVADGLDTALYRLIPDETGLRGLSGWRGMAHALSASHDGASIAVLAGAGNEPKNVRAGTVGGTLVQVSDTRPELRTVRWGSQERLTYRAADGLELEGLLLLPPGRSRQDGPLPLITLVHGGPYGRFADEFQFHIELPPAQWLALAGYAVFLPNPRGSQGRGHAFAAAVAGAVGGAEWSDITDGIDMLVESGVADPGRLGIGGWSHGGFMAAWAVAHTDRFKAAVVGAGITDWGLQTAAGDQGATREAALSGSYGWEGPGPHPHDRVSPVSYASRIQTPVLILHGEEDTNVPVAQAVFLHRALRRFGVEHELALYPGEGHAILGRGHRLDLLHRTRAWFDRWLGPA
ncbi:S9 family peptidase [Streptacidiphilus rugosus]|uniref:S9 family peptidase n=1 Tax=Streptacidiphilus rugosus TaxID=405783 RepID=UPI000A8D63B6|nr:prolyl oligopeptidase family serine peptidase [Streptacidiphilus rugosus]